MKMEACSSHAGRPGLGNRVDGRAWVRHNEDLRRNPLRRPDVVRPLSRPRPEIVACRGPQVLAFLTNRSGEEPQSMLHRKPTRPALAVWVVLGVWAVLAWPTSGVA